VSETVLDALLFDGRTAAATPVRVTVAVGALSITTLDGVLLREARLAAVGISDPLASAPRQIELGDGAVVEVTDGPALTAALAAVGVRAGLVDRLQQRWAAALGALVVSVALLAAGYFWILPGMVRFVASVLPASAEQRLGDGVLEVLDRGFLEPSAISEAKRREVERRVAEAARAGAPGLEYRLLFRTTATDAAVNAFALPGGTIVLLDGLVERMGGDDRLVAVVGHELGHVARRHSTQALLRGAGVGAVTSLLWGDFSGQAASIPAVLAMLASSRDAEREADEEAFRFLGASGRTAEPMLEALCLLSGVEREMGAAGIPNILSSHPKIDERLARAREALGGDAAGLACPPPAPEPEPEPSVTAGDRREIGEPDADAERDATD
jgi:Zn-dependent protease with chaperone function